MATKSPVVLIVDDDFATRNLVVDLLALQGYTAQAAVTGQTALSCLRDGPVDLILIDLMLPDMSGLELCQQVRARQEPRVPIILYSAASGVCWKKNSLMAGAGDDLPQP